MTAAAIPYVTLLGQSSDSDAVRALLDRGDAGPPVLERGDVKAWLDLTSLGIGLVFADEAFLRHRGRQPHLDQHSLRCQAQQ